MNKNDVHPIFRPFIDSLTSMTKPFQNHSNDGEKNMFTRHQFVINKKNGRRAIVIEDSFNSGSTVIEYTDGRCEQIQIDNENLQICK